LEFDYGLVGLSHYPIDLPTLMSWADIENGNAKSCLDVVIQTTNWVIWRYKNRICFDLKPPRKDTLRRDQDVISLVDYSSIC
jgi:hypothetical protein